MLTTRGTILTTTVLNRCLRLALSRRTLTYFSTRDKSWATEYQIVCQRPCLVGLKWAVVDSSKNIGTKRRTRNQLYMRSQEMITKPIDCGCVQRCMRCCSTSFVGKKHKKRPYSFCIPEDNLKLELRMEFKLSDYNFLIKVTFLNKCKINTFFVRNLVKSLVLKVSYL